MNAMRSRKVKMAKKKVEDKWSVGDKVTLPVEFTITAIGPLDKDGNVNDEKTAEVSLVPVDAHVTHITAKLSDLRG